jgi:hypothetical protein
MPGSRKRSGFGFAVSHHARNYKVWIVRQAP